MATSVDPIEPIWHPHNPAQSTNFIRVGNLTIDLLAYRVKINNRLIKLAPTEFRLLAYLAVHIGQAVSFNEILNRVWRCQSNAGGMNQVKCCVKRLRKKIEPDPSRPQYIMTIKGVGYCLKSQTQWEEDRRISLMNKTDPELTPT